MFLRHDIVQVLFSKDSRGNSCITFATIKKVLPEQGCAILEGVISFRGKFPLKASEYASTVEEDAKIPLKRLVRINKNDMPPLVHYRID